MKKNSIIALSVIHDHDHTYIYASTHDGRFFLGSRDETSSMQIDWEEIPLPPEAVNEKVKYRERVPKGLYQDVANLYMDCLPELPAVRELNAQRKGYIRSAYKEHKDDPTWFERFFNHCAKSDFLSGKNRDWRPDMTWLLKNRLSIQEGKYHR